MASLYRSGWRQGSLLSAKLTSTVQDSQGETVQREFAEWVVVTQECDLDGAEEAAEEPLVELRPVYENPGGHSVGVRSEAFVLDGKRLLHAQSLRLMVTPRCLAGLANGRLAELPRRRAELLKTWLGLRYDRPAVPDEFVDLSKAVASAVKSNKGAVADLVLDVLMRLESGDPPGVGLYAVTEDESHRDQIEKWLQGVAKAVPAEIGSVKETVAASVRQVSLWVIQNTCSADVTQLSITSGDKREV